MNCYTDEHRHTLKERKREGEREGEGIYIEREKERERGGIEREREIERERRGGKREVADRNMSTLVSFVAYKVSFRSKDYPNPETC